MTDDLKARRRETANRIHVKASPARMERAEFDKCFIQRQVVIDRPGIESTCQEMFCDECAEDLGRDHRAQLLRALHVTIVDDPLRNFWKLATLKCFGCGFEEIVPLEQPVFTGWENPDKRDAWEREREKFWAERKQQEQAHVMAAQQAQQAAMLGQMLGANTLQNQAATATQIQSQAKYAQSRMDAMSQNMGKGLDEMMKHAEEMLRENKPIPPSMLDQLRKRWKRF